jgi:hypothetical protein
MTADNLQKPEAEQYAVTPPAKKKRSWGGRIAWLGAMIGMGAVLGLVIALGLKFVDGPVSSKMQTNLKALEATPTPLAASSVLSGINFEFAYPGVFDQVGNVKNDASSLEQYNISSKRQYSRLIAVNVRPLASGKLDDDSSYKFRLINPKDYRSSNDSVGSESVGLMTKNDSTEQTLFWPHKGKILTISIASIDPKDNVISYMNMIKPSLRWRQ